MRACVRGLGASVGEQAERLSVPTLGEEAQVRVGAPRRKSDP